MAKRFNASADDLKAAAEADELHQHESEVLSAEIPWHGFMGSGDLDSSEVNMLVEYDKQSEADRQDLLAERGEGYARVWVKALTNIRADRTAVQYLLTTIDKVLHDNPQRCDDFHRIQSDNLNPYQPFSKILGRQEPEYTTAKAGSILAILLATNPHSKCPELGEFVKYLIRNVAKSKGQPLLTALSALKDVLKRPEAQVLFIQFGGVQRITTLLHKSQQNPQLLYLVGFCLWLLSFDEQAISHLSQNEVTYRLIDIIKVVIREKVVRVCVSTLLNMLNKPAFCEREMIASGGVKVLDGLLKGRWKDEDLVKDLTTLKDSLEKSLEDLSSFELYQAEVSSGHLEWTPVHTERFWREHNRKFENENFALIKKLLALLRSAEDELTLAVACYDIGEFARFYDDGRRIVTQLKGKQLLMAQMTNKSQIVAAQALLAVQKLLVSNWESLNKPV
jgi:V-type H+-transporting ATPase subunit H